MSNKEQLSNLPAIVYPSEIDVDRFVFLPIAKTAISLDCMVGYFTSGFLSELSCSVSSYLNLRSNNVMRFIVSPQLSEHDIAAIKNAYESGVSYFEWLFPDLDIKSETVREHSVALLAYLVVSGRIELRIALKSKGIFHSKVWLFNTSEGKVAIHGSANATTGGLTNNFEQLVISRAWLSLESEEIITSLEAKFAEIWAGESLGIETLPLNEKTVFDFKKFSNKTSTLDLIKLKNEKGLRIMEDDLRDKYLEVEAQLPSLKMPAYLNIKTGSYAHQGEAVAAWFENKCKGILSIATGGGKTFTSLAAAVQLQDEKERIFVVIAVPTRPLMNQWADDVAEFGVVPVNTNGYSADKIKRSIKDALRRLRLKSSKAEVLIVTQSALTSGIFDPDKYAFSSVSTLLIVDEVHNLGSQKSQKAFPCFFDGLLGLSATYERQYDEEGTYFLLSTFDSVVYEYGLDKAIGSCLVNYNYYAHFVPLTAEEEDEFLDLTYEIKKLAYSLSSPDGAPAKEKLQRLCLKRRRIIEDAENKVSLLNELLPLDGNDIEKVLIFCTDKSPQQLDNVNDILNRRRVKFHQLTQEETSNNVRLKEIVSQFSNNELQVLTSKRVLDEGFNVPQTETAYILASNTVVRQWTQRLGRVLRTSTATGKKTAIIHDFICVPIVESSLDEDLIGMLKSEYKRVEFFSKYSRNYTGPNGGYAATQKILSLLGEI